MTHSIDEIIFKLDESYAKKNIPFHARPLLAAKQILGKNLSTGLINNPLVEQVRQAYERLIPEVKYTWPGMGTGLIASVDQVKKVTVGIVFGTVNISIFKELGFANHQQWINWCRGNQAIAINSALAYADMHDLVYGINKSKANAAVLWGLASEQLKLVAQSLSQSGSISSPILQPLCLTAELAMKGTLLHLGIPEQDLKNPKLFGHNLMKLGRQMTQEKGHRDDILLLDLLSKFPDYVGDRYRETKLTRLEVISLALSAQFIAASATRRISESDLAKQIEDLMIEPRGKYFILHEVQST